MYEIKITIMTNKVFLHFPCITCLPMGRSSQWDWQFMSRGGGRVLCAFLWPLRNIISAKVGGVMTSTDTNQLDQRPEESKQWYWRRNHWPSFLLVNPTLTIYSLFFLILTFAKNSCSKLFLMAQGNDYKDWLGHVSLMTSKLLCGPRMS